MMKKIFFPLFAGFLLVSGIITSCGESTTKGEGEKTDSVVVPDVKTETAISESDTASLRNFVAFDANKKGKIPVILIVPEWWGMNDYVKNRARQLAELGYFAMVVDMYGDAARVDNPTDAQKLATPFYQNPMEANKRIESAVEKAKTFVQADTENIVAIGYCFGGSMVLNAARAGMPFKGVVSFHGGLAGLKPEKDKIKADVLVCHGAADQFVPDAEVATFKKQMDSVAASYTFKAYADATHAFTNPEATANGKKFNMPIAYNEKADKDSWNDFMAFLDKVFKK